MCNVVLYALHKTRDIWLRKKNTYVALTCMLMVINAIQNALLLGLRLIPPSLRYNDSGYCKVEGAILIVMNLINMWIIFFLSLVTLNALLIRLIYGFGSREDEPVLCNIKKPSSGWDKAGWLYHWTTVFTTFGIFIITLLTMTFLKSQSFTKHNMKLRISGLTLFSKLICLPVLFYDYQF